MNFADFHFLRPEWFLALLPIILIWWLVKGQKSRSSWTAVCDPHLLSYILSGGTAHKTRNIGSVLLCGLLLCLFALAGPTWNKLPQPVFQPQSALVILFDLSRSMDCPDLSPSRLTRAGYKVADILKRRQEGQTALIAFAGEAFTVTPLTSDTNTIASLLGSLSTDIMPSQGSRVDLAIELAVQLIKQAGLATGELLLLGDGFTDQRSLAAAEDIAVQGYRLSVLGVGTREGAPISTGDGFLQDRQGTIIIPRLDEVKLRDLAQRGKGTYQHISVDDRDIDQLLADNEASLRQGDIEQTERFADRWQDQGYWLLLPLLPLAALSFRRGVLFALLLLLPFSTPAEALELQNLWQTPDQQAAKQLQQGLPAEAAQKFTDPQWQAVANYRAGQYQQAADNLKEMTDGTSLYNRGNALAQLGQYQDAIQTYDQITESDPNFPDAQHNKELLQRLLDNQSQQQKNNDQKQDKQDKDQKQKQEQSDNSQQSESEDSNSEQSSERSENQEQQEEQAQQKQDQQEQQSDSEQNSEQRQDSTEQSRAEQKKDESAAQEEEKAAAPSPAEEDNDSQQQANERLLQQIPDDPGNLLKRKFLYQYRQRQTHDEENPW